MLMQPIPVLRGDVVNSAFHPSSAVGKAEAAHTDTKTDDRHY